MVNKKGKVLSLGWSIVKELMCPFRFKYIEKVSGSKMVKQMINPYTNFARCGGIGIIRNRLELSRKYKTYVGMNMG
jgi:hypothetical protein